MESVVQSLDHVGPFQGLGNPFPQVFSSQGWDVAPGSTQQFVLFKRYVHALPTWTSHTWPHMRQKCVHQFANSHDMYNFVFAIQQEFISWNPYISFNHLLTKEKPIRWYEVITNLSYKNHPPPKKIAQILISNFRTRIPNQQPKATIKPCSWWVTSSSPLWWPMDTNLLTSIRSSKVLPARAPASAVPPRCCVSWKYYELLGGTNDWRFRRVVGGQMCDR